jgi:hypothetical protein
MGFCTLRRTVMESKKKKYMGGGSDPLCLETLTVPPHVLRDRPRWNLEKASNLDRR